MFQSENSNRSNNIKRFKLLDQLNIPDVIPEFVSLLPEHNRAVDAVEPVEKRRRREPQPVACVERPILV